MSRSPDATCERAPRQYPSTRDRGDDGRHGACAPERSTPRVASPIRRLALSSGCAHRLVAADDLACRGEYVSRLGRGVGLCGHRPFYPAAPRCDERQHARGFGIRHFREQEEVVPTEREVKRDQLSAHLFAERRNGSLSVFRLCQAALDVLAREATLRDEQWHDGPPVFSC